MCNYITFLTETLKFSSIQNYLSALWYLHKAHGYDTCKGSFSVTQTLRGAKRLLGNASEQAPLLEPSRMKLILAEFDMSNTFDLCFWCAFLTCFHCLLRVSHVTDSHLSLQKSSFAFHSWGVLVTVSKSKTIQFAERILSIPVYSVEGCIFDLSYYFRLLFSRVPMHNTDMVFTYFIGLKKTSLSYAQFNGQLKRTCLSCLVYLVLHHIP